MVVYIDELVHSTRASIVDGDGKCVGRYDAKGLKELGEALA